MEQMRAAHILVTLHCTDVVSFHVGARDRCATSPRDQHSGRIVLRFPVLFCVYRVRRFSHYVRIRRGQEHLLRILESQPPRARFFCFLITLKYPHSSATSLTTMLVNVSMNVIVLASTPTRNGGSRSADQV